MLENERSEPDPLKGYSNGSSNGSEWITHLYNTENEANGRGNGTSPLFSINYTGKKDLLKSLGNATPAA